MVRNRVENTHTGISIIPRNDNDLNQSPLTLFVDAQESPDKRQARAGAQRYVFVLALVRPIRCEPFCAEDIVGFIEVEKRPRRDADHKLVFKGVRDAFTVGSIAVRRTWPTPIPALPALAGRNDILPGCARDETLNLGGLADPISSTTSTQNGDRKSTSLARSPLSRWTYRMTIT